MIYSLFICVDQVNGKKDDIWQLCSLFSLGQSLSSLWDNILGKYPTIHEIDLKISVATSFTSDSNTLK